MESRRHRKDGRFHCSHEPAKQARTEGGKEEQEGGGNGTNMYGGQGGSKR